MMRPATRWRARCCAALLALGAAVPVAAVAGTARYELDPVHTRVMFSISHAGYSQAIGTVSGSTGTLLFDEDDWSTARVEVSVPLERLELGDARWNRAALDSNLLDARDHPVATFVSTRIEPIDAEHASVYGILALHGVENEVKLEVTFNQLKRYPLPPFRRTAGFSATATISRKAFGIDAWPSVIGDSVELRIEAEAVRARGGDDEVEPVPAQAAPQEPAAPASEPASPPEAESEPTPEPTPTPEDDIEPTP